MCRVDYCKLRGEFEGKSLRVFTKSRGALRNFLDKARTVKRDREGYYSAGPDGHFLSGAVESPRAKMNGV
jgi:hypothetical protein